MLIRADLRAFLQRRYAAAHLTASEIESIIRRLERLPAADLYDSNRTIQRQVADGFLFKREDPQQKDLLIQLIDTDDLTQPLLQHTSTTAVVADSAGTYRLDSNLYRLVNQLPIEGNERRIPDAILYINGLPLVVFEFKSAVREEATLHDAYLQLTTRYARDIPELMKYNALCILSDGVNSKMGSLFAPYEFYYAWRKVSGSSWSTVDVGRDERFGNGRSRSVARGVGVIC